MESKAETTILMLASRKEKPVFPEFREISLTRAATRGPPGLPAAQSPSFLTHPNSLLI
ncbi:hypothetical protein OPIT5_29800 [Opitutaceae bacterium TAV5]|nr:hypothetical protein OPIT5_29800 [Opitutaceae bacterium TAV5]